MSQRVTSIGDFAFYKCAGIDSIVFAESITVIGSGAFFNCDGLSTITIPTNVTSIGEYAFKLHDTDASITLTVTAGSYAEQYANAQGYPYVYADESYGSSQTQLDEVVFYFPTGGMSSGALMSVADDFCRLIDSNVTALGVWDDPSPCYGLSFTPEGFEKILKSDATRNGIFELFDKNWGMAEILVDSCVALDQPTLTPLYAYEITIDKFIPSEVHQLRISTSLSDPAEDDNEESGATFSIYPYDEDPFPSGKTIGVDFRHKTQ